MAESELAINEKVAARMGQIGEYFAESVSSLETEVTWESPAELENDLTGLDLRFRIEADIDQVDINATLLDLIEAWDHLRPRIPSLVEEFRSHLLQHFNEHSDEDDEPVDFDEDVDGGYIQLTWWSGRIQRIAHFFAEWDAEHGVECSIASDGTTSE